MKIYEETRLRLINETKNGYVITKQCTFDTTTAIVFAFNPTKSEWVIWRAKLEEDNKVYYHAGFYTNTLNKALLEYFRRIGKYANAFENFYQQRVEFDIQNGI